MRIAVIDDEKYSRVELIHQIRQQMPQAEIAEAGNGVQAMALLEKESFDILFVDIHLGTWRAPPWPRWPGGSCRRQRSSLLPHILNMR